MARFIGLVFAATSLFIVFIGVFPGRASGKIDYAQRRKSVKANVTLARSHLIEAEDILRGIYKNGVKTASSEDLDRYQSEAALSIVYALSAYYMVGGENPLPPATCDCCLGEFLAKLPDEEFTEQLFPESLSDLVKAGIIPYLPWRPLEAYVPNEPVPGVGPGFEPFKIYYQALISERGFLREEGGYREGAMLVVYGSRKDSHLDPRFKQLNSEESWVESVLGPRPTGAVGYMVQLADE